MHVSSRLLTTSAAIAVGATALTGCSSASTKTAGSPPSTPAVATTAAGAPTTPAAVTTTTAAAQPASGTRMTISSFTYDPTPITVAPGTTIAVKNLDGPEHTVTSDTKGLFLADDISSGKTVSFKAPAKAGRYTFHCEYHANMHGTLIVS